MTTTILTGNEAIQYAITNGLNLSKYADPTEEARFDVPVAEARRIVKEDPSLIWVETESLTAVQQDRLDRGLPPKA